MSAADFSPSGGSSIELWLAGEEEDVAQIELQCRIWEELAAEVPPASADLRVEVANRVAVLEGTADHYLVKAAAERAARRVEGVRAVENRIRVRTPAAHVQTDVDLSAAAGRALEWSPLVAGEPVTVRVESGAITLGGEVSRAGARLAAEDVVSRLAGVTDVRNEIVVRPTTHAAPLRDRVRDAIRHERVRHVAVELRGGTVVLSGRVRSLAERDNLEHAVWAVPGVAALADDVQVAP
jgi:osmotically-inducible protein OsmY